MRSIPDLVWMGKELIAINAVAEVPIDFALVLCVDFHGNPQPVVGKSKFGTKDVEACTIHSERMDVCMIESLEEFKACIEKLLDVLFYCSDVSANFLGVIAELLETAHKLLRI
jgi:hypothetical protein